MKTNIFLNSTLKKNITANFVGSVWQAIMALVFVPLYIKFMGIESYGLIGIFGTLQAMFGLLDAGLSSTLTREMARLSALPHKEQEINDLVRTMETIYWGIAVFAGIIVISLSPIIAHHWINSGQLSSKTVELALLIMGFATAIQMPIGFYSGGLIGLQKQVLLNIINIFISTFRGAGAVLVLWLLSPTIQAYLLWQFAMYIINVFLLANFLWRKLPNCKEKAAFQKQLLTGIWRFSAGMSGISILAVILTNIDKVILSKILTLEMFGYYMLASMIATNLGRLFTPVFNSIYPRFTELASANNHDELKRLYHKSSQFIAVLVLPIAIVIAFFSYQVILLWTQNPTTAGNTYLILSIMICGTALNGLMNPPFALQLAFGWTKLSVLKNIVAVILLVPLIYYMSSHYGAKGAASAWLILNIGYIFIEISIMHRRLLPKEKWRWYWQDVFVPIMAATGTASLGRLFFNITTSYSMILLYLSIISILTLGITLISVPVTRSMIYDQFLKSKF